MTGLAATNEDGYVILYATDKNNKLLRRPLSYTKDPWMWVGHANAVVGLTAPGDGFLYAATNDNRLWWRLAAPIDIDRVWHENGAANFVVGLASVNTFSAHSGYLYAATSDNKLWRRDKDAGSSTLWEQRGLARDIAGIAACGDSYGNTTLYAASKDNRLWSKDSENKDGDWNEVGTANFVVALTCFGDVLYAADRDNRLWSLPRP